MFYSLVGAAFLTSSAAGGADLFTKAPMTSNPPPPDIGWVASASRREGDAIYCYLPDWMQYNDVLMASLCALKLPVRLFMPNIAVPLLADLQRYGVEPSLTPFSIKELARSARVFLHHGGFGSCHLGLVAGVPQIAIVSDMEKVVNGRALTTLGAGCAVDFTRLTLPALRQQANEIFDNEDIHRHAAELGGTMRARLTGPDPLDVVAERVFAAA
ncbi:MAG: glycosyltransferase [Xanthobacteraceae bacterium]